MGTGTLVEICRCFDPGEAHIIRGALEAADIPCVILDEHHNTVAWHLQIALGGMRLAVPEACLAEARPILDEIPKQSQSSKDAPWLPGNASGVMRTIVTLFVNLLGGIFVLRSKKSKPDSD